MSLQRVHVTRDFQQPVSELYAHLAESENLEEVFGAKIERVRDGDTSRNGVGHVRRLSIGGRGAFEETVTEAIPDELIRYRITKGGPLKDHEGVMNFSSRSDGGSHLDYTIVFATKIPGGGPIVKAVLTRSITKGLAKLR